MPASTSGNHFLCGPKSGHSRKQTPHVWKVSRVFAETSARSLSVSQTKIVWGRCVCANNPTRTSGKLARRGVQLVSETAASTVSMEGFHCPDSRSARRRIAARENTSASAARNLPRLCRALVAKRPFTHASRYLTSLPQFAPADSMFEQGGYCQPAAQISVS